MERTHALQLRKKIITVNFEGKKCGTFFSIDRTRRSGVCPIPSAEMGPIRYAKAAYAIHVSRTSKKSQYASGKFITAV